MPGGFQLKARSLRLRVNQPRHMYPRSSICLESQGSGPRLLRQHHGLGAATQDTFDKYGLVPGNAILAEELGVVVR